MGAGIAGLSAAVLLAQRGWSVRIHERGPEIREVGAGIFIKNNGLEIFERIGFINKLFGNAVRLVRAEVYDGTGRLLQQRSLEGSARVWNPPRADIVQGLAGIAESLGVEFAFNSTVTAVEPSGAMETEDGSRFRSDLVVAADGFRSRCRESLGLTDKMRTLNTGATRVLVPRTEHECEPITREYWSGKRRVGVAPCTEELVYSYISCPNTDEYASTVPLEPDTWKRSFPALENCGFFERAANAKAVRHPYPFARAESWHGGRVAIVGDAAHALPPTLGQGAGLSLINVHALAETLETAVDVETALERWELANRWVTDQTQKWSLRYDSMTADWPRAMAPVRRGVIWAFGRSRFLNNRMRVADHVTFEDGRLRPRATL